MFGPGIAIKASAARAKSAIVDGAGIGPRLPAVTAATAKMSVLGGSHLPALRSLASDPNGLLGGRYEGKNIGARGARHLRRVRGGTRRGADRAGRARRPQA